MILLIRKSQRMVEHALNVHVSSRHIDGRGSAGRGWKYRSAIYGVLGTVEIYDQIEALKDAQPFAPVILTADAPIVKVVE
ncbi:hypothetical protein OSTOST_13801, partial [Ostertagia ostertagi]